MTLTIEQKGDLRWALLRFLYERQHRQPWPEAGLLFQFNHERFLPNEIDRQDLREALAFLQGLKFIVNAAASDPMSVGGRWSITPEGAITHERSASL